MRYPWLAVGVKVVCTRDDWYSPDSPFPDAGDPVKDGVYTISEVVSGPHGGIYIRLAETRLVPSRNPLGPQYTIAWFRPILPDASKTIATLKQQMRDAVDRELVKARLGETA